MYHSALLERRGRGLDAMARLIRTALDSSVGVSDVTVVASAKQSRSQTETLAVRLDCGRELVLKRRFYPGGDFAPEAHQLRYLAVRTCLRVPQVLALGVTSEPEAAAFLLLERLPGADLRRVRGSLCRREGERLQRELGVTLARMHKHNVGERFGDVVPRFAPRHRSWPECFARGWQGRLQNLRQGDRLSARLLAQMDCIHDHLPVLLQTDDSPRLLHGNLAPTRIFCAASSPAGGAWSLSGILGPALQYGHRELDLALLELNRGVDAAFLEGYQSVLPLEAGQARRKFVYMLNAALERVRLEGHTHQVLQVVELAEQVLRLAAEAR